MTAAETAAFTAGAGAPPDTVLLAIAGRTLTLALVWAMWLTMGIFAAWQSGRASLFDVLWAVLRACIVLLVLGFIVR